jgi:hypothetical protein
MDHLQAGQVVEQRHHQVRRAADPCRGILEPPRPRIDLGNQFLDVLANSTGSANAAARRRQLAPVAITSREAPS